MYDLMNQMYDTRQLSPLEERARGLERFQYTPLNQPEMSYMPSGAMAYSGARCTTKESRRRTDAEIQKEKEKNQEKREKLSHKVGKAVVEAILKPIVK